MEEKIHPASMEVQITEAGKQVWKSIRPVDYFMAETKSIKRSLEAALQEGTINLFALECVVSNPEATSDGIGKIPLTEESDVLDNIQLLYKKDPLAYLIDQMGQFGIKTELTVFLGDDDFVHCVDQNWQLNENASIASTINNQQHWLAQGLTEAIHGLNTSGINVYSWAEIEEGFHFVSTGRDLIHDALLSNLCGERADLSEETLAKVWKRLEAFIKWRENAAHGLAVGENEEHIFDLALQELVSFTTQGHFAPRVIHEVLGNEAPVIFINSFPGFWHEDDVCVRLGTKLGIPDGEQYGTIHLPTPEIFAKELEKRGRKTELSTGEYTPLTCGDPKGGKKRYKPKH